MSKRKKREASLWRSFPLFAVACLLLLPPNGRMEKGKDGEDFETAG